MSNFYIDRIQVEGGFLDGLDISFRNGLNAVIGARGTGKSTLVELIRYCLGISGHTKDSHNKAVSHARSVLKDGQVSVTLTDDSESINFIRTSESEISNQIPENVRLPLIFSQTEVENIGLHSAGKLKLIDGFIDGLNDIADEELAITTNITTYSNGISLLNNSLSDTEDKLLQLSVLKVKLKEAENEEKKVFSASQETEKKSKELNELTERYLEQTASINYVNNYLKASNDWKTELDRITNEVSTFDTWKRDSDNPLENADANRVSAINNLKATSLLINESVVMASESLSRLKTKQVDITRKGQNLRAEVEKIQKGAGEVSRKCQELRKQVAQLEELKISRKEKLEKISTLQKERNIILNELDKIRSRRSELRVEICDNLSKNLSPKIKILIEESSKIDDYKQQLMNAFKGTGLKYNDLAPVMAEVIPPRVLLEIVESGDVDQFTDLISISKERAYRVIGGLKNSINTIATVLLEDEITFELLDGTEYKDFSELSTGQRCTVILPIILEHNDTVLIVDQPEDHIDNAFIVDTLISAILRRSNKGQIIATTHNANVPVLGEAEEVIHLSSDGTRGFVMSKGDLNEPEIINAISRVMEGGKEAFKRRAKFYG